MKRVVCCLDGTWNDNRPGSVLTNVAKLQQVIARSDAGGVRQIAHYVEGIASNLGETAQFLKGAVGFGVADQIRKAYEVLVKDYEPGDEIYLIGFSRGAFEARSLGGLITLLGIAKPGSAFSFEKAWTLYRTSAKERDPAALAELRAAAHYPVRIKCMAVWDTVGNLGNPFISGGWVGRQFAFHDTRLSESIDVALHALSIDELRGPFRPTFFTLPKGQPLPPNQHVEQVWFAGTHADIGGGHRETGLSDIPLLWMAERIQATTGLAIDKEKLAHMARPDPLGPQHAVSTGWIFTLSGLVPFVRLLNQALAGLSPFRRMLFGSWRSSRLPRGEVSINESVHDSVLERFGERVIELRLGRSRVITYRPRSVAAALPKPVAAAAAKPDPDKLRRIKIFTVHGTFAHEADWDNWDPKDDAAKASGQRAFVNRLVGHLKKQGVVVDEVDHTQYNWSGGNSHDERRTAAIGLKKLMQEELSKQAEKHGKDYYDKVFVIAHSHGGTISRLAMNLWDKDQDYYDPVKTSAFDELKHDDQCQTCMRTRNGMVGRNTVRRPDGVITFGSPFVTFEKRWGGMLAAQIGVWVYRILALLPLALLVSYFLAKGGVDDPPSGIQTALVLLFPLVLYWLLANRALPILRARAEKWLKEGTALLVVATVLQAFKYLLLGLLAAYYVVWATGTFGRVAAWLPLLQTFASLFWVFAALVLLWLLIVTLPGRFLAWMREKVVALQDKLPKKYDPTEDRPVPYLSYHTPGDEAGVHLRVFGSLTWLVQTLALSAACVLAVGIALTFVIGIEAFNHWVFKGSVLSRFGISAWQPDQPALQDRFVQIMNWLTYYPALVWTTLFNLKTELNLGDLPNPREVAGYVPRAIMVSIAALFLLLMPLALFMLGVAYLVSMRLRASGLVFGSESFAWTMANRIGVKRRANDNTKLRVMFISPDAWRHQEMAHCYYYKSDKVIEDVAGYLANWNRHKPSWAFPVGGWVSDAARWAVVALFVLSIFAISVPIANSFAGKPQAAQPKPSAEPRLIEDETETCAVHTVTVVVPQASTPEVKRAAARKSWETEVAAKLGVEWADFERTEDRGSICWGTSCEVEARLCKPRPMDCKPAAHGVEVGFELSGLDPKLTSDLTTSLLSALRERWRSEVNTQFGAEWSDVSFNFGALRNRRPVEDGCKEEGLAAGRTRYQCKVAAAPCKKPEPPPAPAPAAQPGRR